MTIIDDDGPGELFFSSRELEIEEGAGPLQIVVERTRGIRGRVSATWRTYAGSANPTMNFEGGSGTVDFEPGAIKGFFTINVVDSGMYAGQLDFAVVLSDATNGARIIDNSTSRAVRNSTSCSVRILPNPHRNDMVDKLAGDIDTAQPAGPDERVELANARWGPQFAEALSYEGSAGPLGLLMFVLSLPWKLLGALVSSACHVPSHTVAACPPAPRSW